ncbi:MAG: hypothetical protein KAH48_01730 [Chlorobi bacterium]|nr:hypothetical protein [Chlorobiota bacterium]
MKKILVMLVFVIGMMLSWVGEIIAHDCPTGYTPMTINMLVGENDCPYVVELCVKCSLTGYTASSVALVGFHPLTMSPACVPDMTYDEVAQFIITFITHPDFYYTYVCTTYDAPPCPQQSVEIELFHYNCWKMELIEYFGEEIIKYSKCGDAYCYEKITWCYDANANEFNRTVVSGPTQVGTPGCTYDVWDPEIVTPTVVGGVSECFIYPTACD